MPTCAMPRMRPEAVALADGTSAAATLIVPDSGIGPGILLLQEIFGVNDFVLGKAEDFAALGYSVLCPDLYARLAPGLALAHDDAGLQQSLELVQRYFGELDEATRISDLVAALAHLCSLPECGGRVAVVGYCLGGTLAYALAGSAELDACVAYYGSGIADMLTSAPLVSCPLLLHYGGSDSYLPPEHAFAAVRAYAGQQNASVLIQPGAGHAFENLLAPAFANPAAAARSWPVTVAFLAGALGPGTPS